MLLYIHALCFYYIFIRNTLRYSNVKCVENVLDSDDNCSILIILKVGFPFYKIDLFVCLFVSLIIPYNASVLSKRYIIINCY